jgi:hypothetical protein
MAHSVISLRRKIWSIGPKRTLCSARIDSLIAITALTSLSAGRAHALSIGLIAGNRNVSRMLTATGFTVPDVVWLYFALAQFPIYLLPHLLQPLAKRLQQSG